MKDNSITVLGVRVNMFSVEKVHGMAITLQLGINMFNMVNVH